MSALVPAASPFDAIKHVDERGEWWSARELMPLMEYSRWEDFATVVEKAKASLAIVQGAGAAEHHFGTCRSDGGRWGTQKLDDYRLTRFGAYLNAMAGDDTKEAVARARVYFATRTREAETAPPATVDVAQLGRRELAQMVIAAEDARELAERRAAELEPRAHSWDVLASGRGDFAVGDAAKILSRDPAIQLGRDKLFARLHEFGWIFRGERGRWQAYQRQVDAGRLSELPAPYTNKRTGETAMSVLVRITPKGMHELHRRLGGRAPLQLPMEALS